MGLGASKGTAHHDEPVKSVRKQIGKRSSVNFFHRQEPRAVPATRVTSFAARVEEEDEVSSDDGDAADIPPIPAPLTSHPVNIPPLSPSSLATVVRLPLPLSPPLLGVSSFRANIKSASSSSSSRSSHDDDPADQPDAEDAEHNSQISHGSDARSSQSQQSNGDQQGSDEPVENFETDSAVEGRYDNAEDQEADTPDTADDSDEPITPLARPLVPPAPLLRALTPLVQESPTRYGFDEAMETARAAVSKNVQKKRATTGPELFKQALELQVSSGFTNVQPEPVDMQSGKPTARRHTINEAPPRPCKIYRPPRSKFPPADVFRRAHMKPHSHAPLQTMQVSPRLIRLLRRPWPANLLRDDVHPMHNVRYALALPLGVTQKSCYGKHARWIETGNLTYPVECAICLCASDCPTDTCVTWMCEFCALRICTECRAVFDAEGTRALSARYADGSRTVEAKKAKASRRSAT